MSPKFENVLLSSSNISEFFKLSWNLSVERDYGKDKCNETFKKVLEITGVFNAKRRIGETLFLLRKCHQHCFLFQLVLASNFPMSNHT